MNPRWDRDRPLPPLRGRVRPYRLPLRRPLRVAGRGLTHREGVLLELRDGAGHRGVGEAAPLPGFSAEGPQEVTAALERAVGILHRQPEGLPARIAALELPPSAASALDQALLELEAARRGLPVPALLDPCPRERVPLCRLVEGPEEARRAVDAGLCAVKVKVAGAPAEAVARVARVRAAVGPAVALRVDANRAWSLPRAREAVAGMADLGVELLEEPVDGPLEALGELRGLGVPIALDESVRTPGDLDRALRLGAGDVLVVKPMFSGGPRAALALLRRAFAARLALVVTSALDGAWGRRAALHAAAAAPGRLLPCGLDTGHLLAEDPGPAPRREGGWMLVDDAPPGALLP